jgi:hypothetical protein
VGTAPRIPPFDINLRVVWKALPGCGLRESPFWLARKGTGSQKWGQAASHPSRSQQLGMVIGWALLREGPKWPRLRFALAPKCCRARTWVMWIEVAPSIFRFCARKRQRFSLVRRDCNRLAARHDAGPYDGRPRSGVCALWIFRQVTWKSTSGSCLEMRDSTISRCPAFPPPTGDGLRRTSPTGPGRKVPVA